MSRRTKLLITALFLVLLAIPAAYIALTWSPDDALRFRADYLLPSSKENPGEDRKLRVSIENTSAAAIHFYGAAMTGESTHPFMLPLHPRKLVMRDLMSGVVTTQSLNEDTPLNAEYTILVPPFLVYDALPGPPLNIPAHSTVHVPATLPAHLVDSDPPRDIFVHYLWETQTRATARNVSEWLRAHSPSHAVQNLFPRLLQRQDTTPLQRSRE